MVTLIQLGKGMENILKQIDVLKHVVDAMDAQYFDIDDKKVMAAKITNLKIKYTQLNKAKMDKLQTLINGRDSILRQPEVTSVFNEFPDILQFFASKQNQLHQELKQLKENNCLL